LRRWLIHYSELSAKRLTGTRRKGRVLVGIIVAASALGSMLAAFSPTAVAPWPSVVRPTAGPGGVAGHRAPVRRGRNPVHLPHAPRAGAGAGVGGGLRRSLRAGRVGPGFGVRPPPGLTELLSDLPQRFVPPGCLGELEATFLPVSIPATLLFEWVRVVFSAVLAVLALRSFLRPVLRDDRSAAHPRALLTAHGGSHLSWMTTWPGYSRWFTTADGTRFVAYRARLGVAITTSDPVCPPHRLAETVRGFADFATGTGGPRVSTRSPQRCGPKTRRWAGGCCRSPRRRRCPSAGWPSPAASSRTFAPH